jgi:hypothetical protein
VLIGNNAKSGSGSSRINTDLPGGLDEAKALFGQLTKGQQIKSEITKDGTTRYYTDDNKTQLRTNTDGAIRIDREIEFGSKNKETIHFNANR